MLASQRFAREEKKNNNKKAHFYENFRWQNNDAYQCHIYIYFPFPSLERINNNK